MKGKIRFDSWTALAAMAALAAAPSPQTTPLPHTSSDGNKTPGVGGNPPEKRSLSISISADRSTSVGAKMRLGGVASDAGPSAGTLRYSWAAASGPAPVFFAQPSSRSTDAVFSVPGLYVLTLTVSNGVVTRRAQHAVSIKPSSQTAPDPNVADTVYPPGAGIFNVRDYGAAGDGATDDTAAIRAAIAAVLAGGNVLYFPAGTYLISDTLYGAADGVPPAVATARLDTRQGCIAGIAVQDGGHGYRGAYGGPGVMLSGGGGWGAEIYARLAGDSVASIAPDAGAACTGAGYTVAPTVRVVNYRAWLRFQGQNRANTVIRLKDHAAGFGNAGCNVTYSSDVKAEYCKAMLYFASEQASNPIGAGEGGYFNDVFDLTLDAGKGNPGAVAIDWVCSNTAAIRRVTLNGASGRAGLNTARAWSGGGNGPALVSGLVVNGFDYGIIAGSGEVGLTLEHVALRGQSTAGLWNDNQNVWIRDLRSVNAAPAVVNRDNGNMALIDASLDGGAPGASAILNQGASKVAYLYARNVSTTGYASAVRQGPGSGMNAGAEVSGSQISEYASHGAVTLFPSSGRALSLPVNETPAPFTDNDFRNWAVVTDYGAIPNDPGDDTGEIQAALNSGKPTVFLPSGTYRISATLHIPSAVRRVLGVISQITIWNTQRAAYPVFSCDAASGGPVEIRSMVFDIYSVGKPSILNNCAVPLVIADVFNANGYENVPGRGLEVYFENAAIPGGVIQHGGRVWARQLDVENDATHVLNDGGAFWILGYKTEGSGDSGNGLLFTRNGGSTEVIGAFNSTPDAGPYARPAYSAVDSKLSISALSAGYRIEKVLSEQRNGQTVTYPNSNTRYGGTALSLYSGR